MVVTIWICDLVNSVSDVMYWLRKSTACKEKCYSEKSGRERKEKKNKYQMGDVPQINEKELESCTKLKLCYLDVFFLPLSK